MESKAREFINKKARFDYHIEEELEAGIVLSGAEVKAIRNGKMNMAGTYARILSGELFWVGADINAPDVDNNRSRKLLLKKTEIAKLVGKLEQKNYSLVPIKAYFKHGKLKLLLGLGKGKKLFDKREVIKNRDTQRDLDRKIRRAQNI